MFYQPLCEWLGLYGEQIVEMIAGSRSEQDMLHWSRVLQAYRVLVEAITQIPEPPREEEDDSAILGPYRDPLAPRPAHPELLADIMGEIATRPRPAPIDIKRGK